MEGGGRRAEGGGRGWKEQIFASLLFTLPNECSVRGSPSSQRAKNLERRRQDGWADAETPRGGRITLLAVGIGCFF
jgi:hypothetical protein